MTTAAEHPVLEVSDLRKHFPIRKGLLRRRVGAVLLPRLIEAALALELRMCREIGRRDAAPRFDQPAGNVHQRSVLRTRHVAAHGSVQRH